MDKEQGTPPADGGQENTGQDNRVVMDREVFNERLGREAAAAVTKLLAEAGFEDVDGLKQELAAAKTLRTEKLTAEELKQRELEAQAKKAEALQAKLTAAEQQLAEIQATQRISTGEEAVRKALGERVKYKDDIIRWARDESPALYKAIWNEDGTVSTKAVDALVKAAEQARPDYFAVTGQGTRSNAGGKPRKQANEPGATLRKVSY